MNWWLPHRNWVSARIRSKRLRVCCTVLRRVHEDEEVRDSYALKGGTALNTF